MSCSCGTGLGNTGLPNCVGELQEVKGLILVETFDSTGARNRVAKTEVIDDAFVDDLINESDSSKRWFPLTALEEIGGERAEAVYQTSASGTKKFVKKGVRNFTAQLWSGGTPLEKSLDSTKCANVSVYQVDATGKLVGIDLGDGYLYPIRIQKSTFECLRVDAKGQDPLYWTISFDWDSREFDTNLAYMVAESDLLSKNGLIEISSEISAIASGSFKATLFNGFGALNNPNVNDGLLIADFALYNTTTSAAVTISTMVENPEGTYQISYASGVTAGNVLRLTPSKDGYSYTKVIAHTLIAG